ncbi:unnamed protein product [Vitrella brassicaformis CCMP3155]|uniref:Ketoreductase (KR) domain-containing protein n=1 Tax=Vitrella brassicaformis (strain CCMP3155) TaxID=1169540 RepID=A0A0G4F720_VITBC|nr:unnamed protein product [Vitrella brassicaformis CCMP3155]|eukprot:CEM07933.1 unnamed protein product [Vitrella brassicaformis CCMP3155]
MGAWYLHELSLDKEIPLGHFMMFSFSASLLGNFGQANYSAANSCLDALTEYRRSKKLAAQSIQWGPWIQQGMAVELKQHLDKAGMRGITNDLGLRVLGDVMRHSESVGVTCCQVIKWDVFLSRSNLSTSPPQMHRCETVACGRLTPRHSATAWRYWKLFSALLSLEGIADSQPDERGPWQPKRRARALPSGGRELKSSLKRNLCS